MSTEAMAAPPALEQEAVAYHSPPDSNSDHTLKVDSDSELSDLEDAEEDIGVVEPDHYADEGRVPVFKVCHAVQRMSRPRLTLTSCSQRWINLKASRST